MNGPKPRPPSSASAPVVARRDEPQRPNSPPRVPARLPCRAAWQARKPHPQMALHVVSSWLAAACRPIPRTAPSPANRSGSCPAFTQGTAIGRTNHSGLSFYLDANCVNAKQRVDALNQLEHLKDRGIVTLMYSKSAHAEAAFRNTKREEKAADFSWTELNASGENDEVRQAIERILFPEGATSQNEQNDVLAAYHAERLRWPLITTDGKSKAQPHGILGRSSELKAIGVEVLTPEMAIGRVKSRLSSAA
jgi:hypothetical protein